LRIGSQTELLFLLSGVTLGPIETISGVGACFATLDNQEGAIPVMLDFMNPACTGRGMIDCRCELRLDELQRQAKQLPEGEEIASRGSSGHEASGRGCY
jgi:hypothetical protein